MKCKALEIILIGLFLARGVESFIIFPCSWYSFAASLLFRFVCFSFIFKELNTMECREKTGTLDSKKIVESGKWLFSIGSEILWSFFLALVFNSWLIPLSIPPTLSGCFFCGCLIYLIAIVSKSIRNEKKQTPNPKLVPPWQRDLCYPSASWNLRKQALCSRSEPGTWSGVQLRGRESCHEFTGLYFTLSGAVIYQSQIWTFVGFFFLLWFGFFWVQLTHTFALHLEMQPC